MNEIDSSKEKLVSAYGHELILDLHGCNPETFTRDHLDRYFTELCELIDMEKCHPHQRHRGPHPRRPWGGLCEHFFLQGIRPGVAAKFTEEWFEADPCKPTFIKRM